MPATDFDVVVLGGGTGGYTAAIRASQLGLKAAVVESGKLGGVCLHWGCIPTKALLQSSELLYKVRDRGQEFGLTTKALGFDYGRIADRRDAVVTQLYKGVQGLMKKNRIEVVEGEGIISDRGTVRVGSTKLSAKNLILATGSGPRGLSGIEFDGKLIINSDHATTARELPESIAIIGAGAIGVEFATFYSEMGSKVILLEALDRLVPLEDEDISKEMLRALQKKGIDCRTGVRVKGAKKARGGVSIQLEGAEVWANQLLVAIGRSPNSEGLEKSGAQLDQRGFVKVDEWMRTGAEGVWAIGDVVGGYLLAHAAAHEGVTAAEDIAGKRVLPMHQELVTRCTYSHPQIASVGLSEAQAKAAGHEVKIGRFPFAANGRAIIHGETGGFAKVVADASTGQILGTHIVGVEATELIAEAALAQLFQGDAWELGRNIHPHPTLSEVIGEAGLAVDGAPLNI